MCRMTFVEHNKQTAGGETLRRRLVETGYQVSGNRISSGCQCFSKWRSGDQMLVPGFRGGRATFLVRQSAAVADPSSFLATAKRFFVLTAVAIHHCISANYTGLLPPAGCSEILLKFQEQCLSHARPQFFTFGSWVELRWEFKGKQP